MTVQADRFARALSFLNDAQHVLSNGPLSSCYKPNYIYIRIFASFKHCVHFDSRTPQLGQQNLSSLWLCHANGNCFDIILWNNLRSIKSIPLDHSILQKKTSDMEDPAIELICESMRDFTIASIDGTHMVISVGFFFLFILTGFFFLSLN